MDHKKDGSSFIPPMSQLGLSELSYVNQIFPEIIWMGLLNKREGYHAGTRIIEFMAKRLSQIKTTKKFLNFSLASSYGKLSTDQKTQIVGELDQKQFLSILQESLAPLTCLYDRFPMAFIGPPYEHINRDTLLNFLKECISECINKYEQPGMVIQASVMYIRAITGGLYFRNNLKPPNLQKIITDFDSEEGQLASASVRAFVLSEPMVLGEEESNTWAKSFWNQGYKIDICQFPWDNNG